MHKILIRVPDGEPANANILLDGKRLEGVTNVAFSISADRTVPVTLTILAEVEADLSVVERTFVSDGPGSMLDFVRDMKVLRLVPGDVLVLSHPHHVNPEALEGLGQWVRECLAPALGLPPDTKALVLQDGALLGVVRTERKPVDAAPPLPQQSENL